MSDAQPVTFDSARAACVAEWGEPIFSVEASSLWPSEVDWCFPPDGRSVAQVAVSTEGGRVWLSAFSPWDGAFDEDGEWTLAGEPTDAAPFTTLPNAIAAAAQWMRERGVAPVRAA